LPPEFEKSILAFADTPPQSRKNSIAGSERRSGSFRRNSLSNSTLASFGPFTPVSTTGNNSPRRPSNLNNIAKSLDFASYKLGKTELAAPNIPDESPFLEEEDPLEEQFMEDVVDMAVRILPGVKDLINSLPEGKYAVATSGARTYCHGCLKRTDIKIPSVCVTADDPRLTRGKPFPDPFLLAASDLGIDPKKSVIFEDSPSGIKAAVAAGGTVIAVCTSHKREQIDKFGAHYIVDTMEQIKVTVAESGELEFTVKY
jgi:HAD superfamily hydrolase (TIGR01509 family)